MTDAFWTSPRIFAVGQSVTEFQDSNDYKEQINQGKTWREYHRGTIVCASIRDPEAIVTGCTDGDLIFWRFKSGQPYLRFNVELPTHRLQVVYNNKKHEMKNEIPPEGSLHGTEKTVSTEEAKKNKSFEGLEDRFELP